MSLEVDIDTQSLVDDRQGGSSTAEKVSAVRDACFPCATSLRHFDLDRLRAGVLILIASCSQAGIQGQRVLGGRPAVPVKLIIGSLDQLDEAMRDSKIGLLSEARCKVGDLASLANTAQYALHVANVMRHLDVAVITESNWFVGFLSCGLVTGKFLNL